MSKRTLRKQKPEKSSVPVPKRPRQNARDGLVNPNAAWEIMYKVPPEVWVKCFRNISLNENFHQLALHHEDILRTIWSGNKSICLADGGSALKCLTEIYIKCQIAVANFHDIVNFVNTERPSRDNKLLSSLIANRELQFPAALNVCIHISVQNKKLESILREVLCDSFANQMNALTVMLFNKYIDKKRKNIDKESIENDKANEAEAWRYVFGRINSGDFKGKLVNLTLISTHAVEEDNYCDPFILPNDIQLEPAALASLQEINFGIHTLHEDSHPNRNHPVFARLDEIETLRTFRLITPTYYIDEAHAFSDITLSKELTSFAFDNNIVNMVKNSDDFIRRLVTRCPKLRSLKFDVQFMSFKSTILQLVQLRELTELWLTNLQRYENSLFCYLFLYLEYENEDHDELDEIDPESEESGSEKFVRWIHKLPHRFYSVTTLRVEADFLIFKKDRIFQEVKHNLQLLFPNLRMVVQHDFKSNICSFTNAKLYEHCDRPFNKQYKYLSGKSMYYAVPSLDHIIILKNLVKNITKEILDEERPKICCLQLECDIAAWAPKPDQLLQQLTVFPRLNHLEITCKRLYFADLTEDAVPLPAITILRINFNDLTANSRTVVPFAELPQKLGPIFPNLTTIQFDGFYPDKFEYFALTDDDIRWFEGLQAVFPKLKSIWLLKDLHQHKAKLYCYERYIEEKKDRQRYRYEAMHFIDRDDLDMFKIRLQIFQRCIV